MESTQRRDTISHAAAHELLYNIKLSAFSRVVKCNLIGKKQLITDLELAFNWKLKKNQLLLHFFCIIHIYVFFLFYFTNNQHFRYFSECLKHFAMQTNIVKIIKGSCSQYYRSVVKKSSNVNSMQPWHYVYNLKVIRQTKVHFALLDSRPAEVN